MGQIIREGILKGGGEGRKDFLSGPKKFLTAKGKILLQGSFELTCRGKKQKTRAAEVEKKNSGALRTGEQGVHTPSEGVHHELHDLARLKPIGRGGSGDKGQT